MKIVQVALRGGQITLSDGWSNPVSFTTPDFYDSCSAFWGLRVPRNQGGYQSDCNGGASYAAVFALEPQYPNDGHEYIQIQLSDTLIQYHKYAAAMYVSLSNYSNYAIGSMGMYFTANAIQGPSNVGFIDVPSPQIKGKSPLTDTLNWMAVQDTFVAQGGELYLTIGNFSYDSLSDTLYLGWRGVNGSYYYIDSVTVYDTGLMGVPDIKKQEADVKIFPNPGDGHFQVIYGGKETAILQIEDLQGRLLAQKELPSGSQQVEMDCENLENGVYLFKVIVNGNALQTKKLIIAK